MALWTGVGLAIAVAVFGRLSGFDRERAFYCTVLIVVASYYILFAAVAGAGAAAGLEILPFLLFAAVAVTGFRTSMLVTAVGLASHGLFDLTRQVALAAAGAPAWWPAFCLGFDVGAGAILALLLLRDRSRETPR